MSVPWTEAGRSLLARVENYVSPEEVFEVEAEAAAKGRIVTSLEIRALDMALRYSQIDHDYGCAVEQHDPCSCGAREWRNTAQRAVERLSGGLRLPSGDYIDPLPAADGEATVGLDPKRLASALGLYAAGRQRLVLPVGRLYESARAIAREYAALASTETAPTEPEAERA